MFARSLLVALAALGGAAQAATLSADGQWAVFDVAQDLSGTLGWIDITDGSALSFDFTIAAGSYGILTVVDGGFAGDRFNVSNGPNQGLGMTSEAINSYPANVFLDFEAALADPRYSRGVFTLGSGTYSITGGLLTSALDDTQTALNSTVGGIRLEVSPVPEPATVASMLAGLGVLAGALRRRRSV
jgi:PEP-CTERM motif